MEKYLYDMIFKRKSFHLFRDIQQINPAELDAIKKAYASFVPLVPDIKTAIKIVPAEQTTCKRGAQFCILMYSEKKENYLQNIGYLGEQLDLFLTSLDIGALWFGIGKPDEMSFHGLDFVIMIAIAKMPNDKFRKNMFKSKRKPLEEIWTGPKLPAVAEIIRFAPSACNTQPWVVEADGRELRIYRYKKPGKRGIMPIDKVTYYNRIDIGIFLLFLDICLDHEQIRFTRSFHEDLGDNEAEKTLAAAYTLL